MKLRVKFPNTVLIESVTVFIHENCLINKQIQDDEIDNIEHLWGITIDLKECYPSIENQYAFKSLRLTGNKLDIDPKLEKLLKTSLKVSNENAHFELSGSIYKQELGQMIGGDGSGDVCDCSLLMRELLNYDKLIHSNFLFFHRCKDDIDVLMISKTKPNADEIKSTLSKIYDKNLKCKIKIGKTNEFLDVTYSTKPSIIQKRSEMQLKKKQIYYLKN